MESFQWFLLGMMAAWTPSLVILALLLPTGFHQETERLER